MTKDIHIKFTQADYQSFIKAYYKGSYPFLRFGQAFFAHFSDRGMGPVKDQELFYCEDMKIATKIIHERYIK